MITVEGWSELKDIMAVLRRSRRWPLRHELETCIESLKRSELAFHPISGATPPLSLSAFHLGDSLHYAEGIVSRKNPFLDQVMNQALDELKFHRLIGPHGRQFDAVFARTLRAIC